VLLAIETSCDETAVAVFDLAKILSGTQLAESILAEEIASSANLHEAYGGIVPELAAREQTLTLPPLVERVFRKAGIQPKELTAVAVTAGPGLNGSLLVGLSYAKGLSYALKIPLIPINHLEGHLSAHLLLPNKLTEPFVSLLVSGGHTEVILETKKRLVLAKTRDDAAGEAFDKCATLLGLPYPGGPELSRLAALGNRSRFDFPVALPEDLTSFSFSGLKTAVLRAVKEIVNLSETDRQDIAASTESAIVRALVTKTIKLALENKATGVFLTGGVAANSFLRLELERECIKNKLAFQVADLKYCTDNATMIAAAAVDKILKDQVEFINWVPVAGSELGPKVSFNLHSRTSWSV
jgi:N6-L-threonylcarbamoyladenine synthase